MRRGSVWWCAVGLAAMVVMALAISASWSPVDADVELPATVGRQVDGTSFVPVGQWIRPTGKSIDLPGSRPQAIAISPDGRLMVTAGKSSDLVLLDPDTATVLGRVALPSEQATEPPVSSANILEPDRKGQLSFTGLVFSPDGRRLYLSNVNGSIKVFGCDPDRQVKGLYSIGLPPANAPRRQQEIPAGLALSPGGRRLYVCGNLSNRLFELDSTAGTVLRSWDVGVAPYDVVLAGDHAYVSCWGGRRPQPGELTGPAGRGTVVKVDPVRHIANEGSISVIDVRGEGGGVKDIVAQLHASALALSPDRRYLVCANAASDNLTVVSTADDTVVETIWVKASPNELFGATPNALCFSPDGQRLYVANGTQNALAVVDFRPGASKLLGLVAVGWFPGGVVFDRDRRQLAVANLKGLPAEPRQRGETTGFNSHQYTGSVTFLPVPDDSELPGLTATVYRAFQADRIAAAARPPRPNQPPRPVPERIGEPSVFRTWSM